MDMMFEAYLTHETGHLEPDDFPQTKEPVWILGKKYNPLNDLERLRADVRSKLWFTYRRAFVSIGDTGQTSDKGWGCMLRCGQMVLAQALICLHLGRDWVWTPETKNPTYLRILRMFEDRRSAPYSIHQIALMGASEGKDVGQWFGPNTVAQVLRKLAVYDEWSQIVVHVALDNTLIVNDVKKSCLTNSLEVHSSSRATDLCTGEGSPQSMSGACPWRPLLLVVPLRLGLSEINPVYVQGLKTCLTFKQSLGVIGGKPNHALYFIGSVGDEVVFLDPHTTQQAGFVEDKDQNHEKETDNTYHCRYASRISILHMDPSVALCFFCSTEAEFDSLCQQIQQLVVSREKQPLFELCNERPRNWSPLEDGAESSLGAACLYAFEDFERQFDDSDEDFELLG